MIKKAIAALALLIASPVSAATLISTATGNIDATATWSVIDTTGTNAYLNSETANTALTTSPVASSTFTPAAETLTAIGVKLASVAASPSGTMTVKLANSTSPGSRECTQTVNVTDLTAVNGAPAAATADGGLVILSCSASPNGTDSYTINASTSVASMVNLFSLATTNWSHLLVTNGTQANGPAAGDKFIVQGVLTGAGTHNAFTVTVETTANINYGNVANTLVDPSISVGQWGTLAFASAASTNYKMEVAGPLVVYNGGTFTQGTVGTPIPASSTAILTLNSTTEGDTGVNNRNGSVRSVVGSSGGRNVVKAKLAVQATGGATSTITTDVSTGWLSGDSIYIAGTTITSNAAGYKGDAATLSGNATTTSVPLSAAVTNTHTAEAISYTSANTGVAYSMNKFADVILLTRNVIVQGATSSNNGYEYSQPNASVTVSWARYTQMSGISTATGKRGFEADTGPLGLLSVTNASFDNSHHEGMVLAPVNTNFGGTPANPATIQHVTFNNVATDTISNTGSAFGMVVASRNVYIIFDDIAVIYCSNGTFGQGINLFGSQMQFTKISISGSGFAGNSAIQFTGSYSSASSIGGGINSWGPISLYANTGNVSNIASFGMNGTINGLYVWNENGRFNWNGGGGNVIIDPFYMVSSTFSIYVFSNQSLTVRNGIIGFETGINTTTPALTLDSNANPAFYFDNMELCPTGSLGGISWAGCSGSNIISLMHDLGPTGGVIPTATKVYLRNTSTLSPSSYPTMNGQEGYYSPNGFVTQDCNGCSIKHAAWVLGGFLSYDVAISHSSGFSLRMTPRVNNFLGYITAGSGLSTAGNVLTITTAGLSANAIGDYYASAASGFVPGTISISASSNPPYTVSQTQTVGSPASPVLFLSYNGIFGNTPPRMQSAPAGMGTKIAVASGVSTAQACVWLRPSINTDAAPPWGGSAVTYNGDAPRMLVRQNPYMGIQSDTVIGTSAPTAGAWSQFCATLPTAPADGEFEVVVDADQTFTSNAGGSVNIAEWSCTGCSSGNSSQFWWNGVPTTSLATSGSGSHTTHVGIDGIWN